jgi:hypothetical protein
MLHDNNQIQILRDLNKIMEDPWHFLEKGTVPVCYNYLYEGMMYKVMGSVEDVKNMQTVKT